MDQGESHFEKQLEAQLQRLKLCQQDLQKTSCLQCEKILECQTRKAYVKAVYQSMNHGKSGDFAF